MVVNTHTEIIDNSFDLLEVVILKKISIIILLILGFATLVFFIRNSENQTDKLNSTVTPGVREGYFFGTMTVKYPIFGEVVIPENDSDIPLGVAVQTYELNFGRAPKEMNVSKMLNLSNSRFTPVKFLVESYGNISKFLYIPKEKFIIPSNMDEKLTITFDTRQPGNFTGELIVRVVYPKYEWLIPFLDFL